jgi:hypothetical protein
MALLEQLHRAQAEYIKLLTDQLAAGRKGDGLMFDDEVQSARRAREAARELVVEHQRLHGC